jgi:PIN domain nuclease of toxin-antitoxin system
MLLAQSVISTVTLAELHSVLSLKGPDEMEALNLVLAILADIVPFSATQAHLAGDLRGKTKALGLSLALELDADVYTSDRAWLKASAGCRIHLIR